MSAHERLLPTRRVCACAHEGEGDERGGREGEEENCAMEGERKRKSEGESKEAEAPAVLLLARPQPHEVSSLARAQRPAALDVALAFLETRKHRLELGVQ